MKIFLYPILSFIIVCTVGFMSVTHLQAGTKESVKTMTTAEQLDVIKKSFLENADTQLIADFDQGVIDVQDMGVVETAKQKGDIAPDFTLPESDGEKVTLSTLLQNGPVVLVWYRGEWCPYCNVQLRDIQNHSDAFKNAGATIVAISPELPERGVAVQNKLELGFHVLSDVGNTTAKDYGVVYTLPPKIAEILQERFNIHEKNDDESNQLPLAAAYVINTDGKISYAYLDADYRNRVETSVLLDEVKKLKNGKLKNKHD